MLFTEILLEARFLKRYKRFFADVDLDGEVVVAHVPNTGSLKTCLFENARCIVSKTENPARKLKATLHFIQTPTGWVGVNTSLPNFLVHEAWEEKRIGAWTQFQASKREYKISKETRLDMVLAPNEDDLINKRGLHFIEIKNVSYANQETAFFPDAVTARGQKHLQELMELKKQGFGAEIVFVVQRQDCSVFSPANDIDPIYAKLLREAARQGVTVSAYGCDIDPKVGVSLNPTPLRLSL